MRTRTIGMVSLLLAGVAAASLRAQPVTSRIATLPAGGEKIAGTAVVYSKSFFQERYMQVGKTVGYALFVPGVFQNAVWRASGQYEGKAADRRQANAFEELLGDLDLTALVGERLHARLAEARRFDFDWPSDSAGAEALIGLAASEGRPAGDTAAKLTANGSEVFAAFKVSYGFGARAGKEQLGFKKTYRPFVRLLGVVRRTTTGEQLWHGAVIAWGANGYKGHPDAKAISREEIVAAFTPVCDEVVTLLLRSLDGEPLDKMGDLVDETKEDGRF